MLRLENVDTYYGNMRALSGVSLDVPPSSIVTLLGANGAGKTTALRTIGGFLRPAAGLITYEGKRIDGLPPDRVMRLGISMVPERRSLFSEMTVAENLTIGAFARTDKAGIAEDREKVFTLFPDLLQRQHQIAETLSGGQQQMLAIGRALMARPRLLLLDEPSLGLAPILIAGIFRAIKEINVTGVAVLLVEQNAHRALPMSQYAYVLDSGHVTLSGWSADLIVNTRVKQSYLGEL